MINLNNWDVLHRLLLPMMESGMFAILIWICFKNKFLNTRKVAIALILTKCPTPATRQERLVWEVQSQREFVVRVLGREVLAPPCASWLTRHPERDPLPPPPPPPPPHHHNVLKVKCCFFRSWHKFVGPLSNEVLYSLKCRSGEIRI